MKKQFTLTILAIFVSITVFAQEEKTSDFVSKRGVPILPEAGDYAIGIDATPFFTYIGNMFNANTSNSAPSFSYTAAAPLIITGKKMIDAKTAYRGIFRIGFTNDKTNFYVPNDAYIPQNPSDTSYVKDSKNLSQMHVALGFGLEKRRGKGRLQGIYGAQVIFGMNTHSEKYTYANAMDNNNITPTTYNFNSDSYGPASQRVTSNKQGFVYGVNLQAFIGAEYFFAPKFSISGELTYGLYFVSQGDGILKEEQRASNGTETIVVSKKTAGETHFGIDTGVAGTLNLNFYF